MKWVLNFCVYSNLNKFKSVCTFVVKCIHLFHLTC
jgi:hypothetical protein